MDGLLRILMIWICVPFYKLIPVIYNVFYDLANHRFFQPDPETGVSVIEQLSSNLYVLVSVVMLFVFSANILAAIVNPDLMNDKKKGIGALFKRAIIGIALIVIIPFAFDEAYKIQQSVMDRSLIEKVLVGISYEDENNKGGNGGQVIAGTLISSVLHPIENNGEPVEIAEDVSEDYELMVTEDIDHITKVAKHINVAPENSDKEYAFEFQELVALIAGGVCCYLLLIFAFDMAVRTVKLAFLELTAPISVIAYMAAGEDTLKKWAGTVLTTFLEVFMRIACMAFYIFMISQLENFLEGINGNWFVKILLIVGMLIFVKELPQFINKAFGINVQTKGGIGGRLGSMAAVGDVAKKGWDTVSKGLKTVGLGAAGAGVAVGTLGLGATIGAGIGAGVVSHGWNKGFKHKILGLDLSTPGKETKIGKGLTKIGNGVTTAGKVTGAYLGSGNPIKGVKEARKVIEETDSGASKKYQREQGEVQKIKDEAKSNAQTLANTSNPGIYDAAGNLDKNIAQTVTFKPILDSSKLNDFEKKVTLNYDTKRHEKRLAENDQYHYDSISKTISNAISATSNSTEKQELLSLQSKIDSGTINANDIKNKLGQISSMLDPSGSLNATAQSIVDSATKIARGSTTNNITSKVQIEDKLTSTTAAFSVAETEFNNMTDKMDNKKKAQTKAMAKVGDDISKSKIKK